MRPVGETSTPQFLRQVQTEPLMLIKLFDK